MSSRKLTQKRAALLAELEGIVGNNCYNASIQNWGANGVFLGEGRGFRYPLTVLDGEGNKQKVSYRASADDPVKLLTGYYAFGANKLSIMMALDEVLQHLENNHGLKL